MNRLAVILGSPDQATFPASFVREALAEVATERVTLAAQRLETIALWERIATDHLESDYDDAQPPEEEPWPQPGGRAVPISSSYRTSLSQHPSVTGVRGRTQSGAEE